MTADELSWLPNRSSIPSVGEHSSDNRERGENRLGVLCHDRIIVYARLASVLKVSTKTNPET